MDDVEQNKMEVEDEDSSSSSDEEEDKVKQGLYSFTLYSMVDVNFVSTTYCNRI